MRDRRRSSAIAIGIELEAGARWTDRQQGTTEEQSTELFFTAGYRYDFYADGRKDCLGKPAAQPCR